MPTDKVEKAQGWRSITEVLGCWHDKDSLDFYLDHGRREANRIMNAAGKIGTRVHEACERGDLKPKDADEVKSAYAGWEKWMVHYAPADVEWCNKPLRNQRQMVVGHHDFCATIDGVRYVVDIKTSYKGSWKHKVQAAWYGKELGLAPALLYLSKTTSAYKFVVLDDVDSWVFVGESLIWLTRRADDGIDV